MAEFEFLKSVKRASEPFDLVRLEHISKDFDQAVARDEALQTLAQEFSSLPIGKALLDGVFGNSPYLTRIIMRDPGWFLSAMQQAPSTTLKGLIGDLEASLEAAPTMLEAMKHLRQAKARAALIIALADIAGIWSFEETTKALTNLADQCLNGCLRYLLRAQEKKGKYVAKDPSRPEEGSGIIILAMGKYGAFELNYSSDIDIIVFFEAEQVPIQGDASPQSLCIRVTRDLVKMMQEPTGDGYVFRTDLRLRPDASATAIALSTEAGAFYYETMGQNWERAAMIKARAAAGDLVAGNRFLQELTPFVWRRYLDYAAIEDVHSIKRQIHAHKGHGQIAIEGHNVKLGRGGIREIEFFAQTQQLIGGGRDPSLRSPTTLGALDALVAAKIVKPDVAADLKASYGFLREVEHRIQMVNDEQTHLLPKTKEGVDHIATFCGFESPSQFRETLRAHLLTVQNHYAELFEEELPLGSVFGNLVFTGVEDDPGTLETLKKMGFDRASDAAGTIRGWHHGRLRLMRSERARALLTKLTPHLLEAMSQTANPDAALANFHHFLAGLPAGVQLFSMLQSHPDLMGMLTEILGTAPRLANTLSKNANVLDALLDSDFLGKLATKKELESGLSSALARADYYETKLDAARIWTRESKFRVGVNVLHGDLEPLLAAKVLSDMADTVIAQLQEQTQIEMESRHGTLAGGLSVIAMGKLGSRELSVASDLDIIFVYDGDPDDQSNGAKPLHTSQYFARLSQRLISAISAPTAEGSLYEVDARLRPSGKSGPLAVTYEGFRKYQFEDAWTWEKMALTRARVITGPKALRTRLDQTIRDVLCQPREVEQVLKDAREMRLRIANEITRDNPWDLKHVRGGLVDLEFTIQTLQLIHAAKHPQVLNPNTMIAIGNLHEAGAIDASLSQRLIQAAKLLHRLTQIIRYCVEGTFDPDTASHSLIKLLTTKTGTQDFPELDKKLRSVQQDVLEIFENLVEGA